MVLLNYFNRISTKRPYTQPHVLIARVLWSDTILEKFKFIKADFMPLGFIEKYLVFIYFNFVPKHLFVEGKRNLFSNILNHIL